MAYIGKQPVVGNFVKLDAIVTSATTTFNLLNGGVAYFPQSANNCIVSLNGIIQEPTSSGNVGGYTISGSTIVFTSALTTLDVIDFILVLGDTLSIGTPSDGTVSFAKVTSNLITGATSEATIDGADSVLIYDDSATALRKMTRTNFVAGIGGANTPIVLVSKSTTQSVSYNTVTVITFNTENIDTDNAFASNTFTVPSGKAGKYFAFLQVTSDDDSDNGLERINIRVNGSGIVQGSHKAPSADETMIYVSTILDLSVGDTVDATYFTYAGGTSAIYGNDNHARATTLGIFKLI
jgi:hypothetical protein